MKSAGVIVPLSKGRVAIVDAAFADAVLERGSWYIRRDGRSVYLGVFATKESAARAYDLAAREAFGSFASLNFPAAS